MDFNMESFLDEMNKIAASREAATWTQTRSGKRSIRAHNLLKKAEGPSPLLPKPTLKALGLLGTGAAAYHFGKKSIDDWQLGRQVRKAQEQAAE